MSKKTLFSLMILVFAASAIAQNTDFQSKVAAQADQIEARMIEWRRDFHQNPELSNREFKTADKVAAHLKKLGIEVQTGVAKTGVVGILKGGKPGPVVALRADMDALPVVERVAIPFASKAVSEYNGQQVGVMHACGHDTHVAILMAVAEILSQNKSSLEGTVKFIFQPAEEGAPNGEEGGAGLMVKEGVLDNPKVDVIFGLHINAQTEVNTIKYKSGGTMASSDILTIKVKGKQAHGAYPWLSVDPIVASAQIINGLQTIISRQTELTQDAAVITIGTIHGGVRNNIIPEEVELTGTIRALDKDMQKKIHEKIKLTAEKIAESSGAKAEVTIKIGNPVTYNDPALTAKMVPSLVTIAGNQNVNVSKAVTGAEDFAIFQEQVPGFYFFLGGMPKGKKIEETVPHHTPDFYIDESGLKLGIKALCQLTYDYMKTKGK